MRPRDWQATVRRDDIDAVFVATTHDQLAPIAAEAAAAGKHVLIEKPGARCGARARRGGRSRRAHGCAGPRRLQPSLPSRLPEGARDLRERRAGRDDVHPRAATGTADVPATTGNGAPTPDDLRRRRTDRSGHAPDRSLALVPGRISRACAAAPAPTSGTCRWRTTAFCCSKRRAGRWPSCTPVGPSGRISSPSRSAAGWASSKLAGLGGSYGTERLTCYKMSRGNGAARNLRLGISHGRRFLAGRKRRLP